MSCDMEFVFVHSYSSNTANWKAVMLGDGGRLGRIDRAIQIAEWLDVPLVANDGLDHKNRALYDKFGIENLRTARNTNDEVISALRKSTSQKVLFVTSPDHLPRVVRDALSAGGANCLFAASEIPFSAEGALGVNIHEPEHQKGRFSQTSG